MAEFAKRKTHTLRGPSQHFSISVPFHSCGSIYCPPQILAQLGILGPPRTPGNSVLQQRISTLDGFKYSLVQII
ncbi:hypothetical protein AOLI_G00000780 [Acnodon oligacanthus]